MDRSYIQNTIRNALYSYIMYSEGGIAVKNGGRDQDEREALIKECDEDELLGKVRTQITGVADYYRSSLLNMTCLLFDRNFWLLPECDGYSDNPHKRESQIGVTKKDKEYIYTYGALVQGSKGAGIVLQDRKYTYGTAYTCDPSRMLPVDHLEAIWNGILWFNSWILTSGNEGNITQWGSMSYIRENPFTGDDSAWLVGMTAEQLNEGLKNFEESKCFQYLLKEDFDVLFHGRQLTMELRTVLTEWCKKHSDALDTPADSE